MAIIFRFALLLIVSSFLLGCDKIEDKIFEEKFPSSEKECRIYAFKHATSAELGNFLLNQCSQIINPLIPKALYNAGLDILLGDGVQGKGGVNDSKKEFTARIYNQTGVDLLNLVIRIDFFENEKDLNTWKEAKDNKNILVHPTTRFIKFEKVHQNLMVEEYSSILDTSTPFWSWTPIDGNGYRIDGIKTAWQITSEKIAQLNLKSDDSSQTEAEKTNKK
jgi:hypothetical protein